MRPCSYLGSVALLALLLACIGTAEASQPYVVQLACDTLGAPASILRVQFAIVNDGLEPVCRVGISGGPDGPPVYCNATPFDWACSGSLSYLEFSTQAHCIAPGEAYGPFAINTWRDQGLRFAMFYFKDLTWEYFAMEWLYPTCEPAISARVGTWGRIKALYR